MSTPNVKGITPGIYEWAPSKQIKGAEAPEPVCAIVVAFFPEKEFAERLQKLLPQVTHVIVVDNTPGEGPTSHLKEIVRDMAKVHLIENRTNAGIAKALNQGLEHALDNGYQWILTLDQDTQCYPDMVDTLLKVSKACEPRPAVIGGNYLDQRNKQLTVSLGEAEDFVEQKTVITSGSLIDAHVARAIGGFKEDYFIDQVDHEFCLRARAHGHKVVISRKPVMTHSVGRPGGVRLPVLGVLPNHPALRKYYIARNTVVTVAEYWRREPEWCLRRLVRLLLGLGLMAILEKHRLGKVRAFAAGIVDGLQGRMGPCPREWIQHHAH